MHHILIQRTFGSLVEKPLINVSVPHAERRVEYFIREVESIDQVDGVRSNCAQQRGILGLQLQDVLPRQIRIL